MHGHTRQAKTLNDSQINRLLDYVAHSRSYSRRNRVMVLLSFRAGLRSKEIGALTWGMVTDAEGQTNDALELPNSASKGRSGRVLPLRDDLKAALCSLHEEEKLQGRGRPTDFVLSFKKGSFTLVSRANTVQCTFRLWYRTLRFHGASSHSGRRTFITRAARKVSLVGGSLRDVQALAGHSSIQVTQRYVDCDPDAQQRLVQLI